MSDETKKGLGVFMATIFWLACGTATVGSVMSESCPRHLIPLFTSLFIAASLLLICAMRQPAKTDAT